LSPVLFAQGKPFTTPEPRVRSLKAEKKDWQMLLSSRCPKSPKGKICKDAFNSEKVQSTMKFATLLGPWSWLIK
jgi:hypothetical protein